MPPDNQQPANQAGPAYRQAGQQYMPEDTGGQALPTGRQASEQTNAAGQQNPGQAGQSPQQGQQQPQQQPNAQATQQQPRPQPSTQRPTPDNQPKPNAGQSKKSKDKKGSGKKANTTQKSLLVSEIRDGIVIMRDGSLRSVVMCQSVNFDLMSPQEREGVEQAYQQFLNSLEYAVQIYIRSQRINLDSYLEKLQNARQNQDNILLGLLMEDYIEYIKYLVEAANIMDKQFYVIVPYYPSGLPEGITSGAKKFTELFKTKKKDVVTVNENEFNKHKQELTRRARTVANGLNRIGTQAVPLNTQELIELYYNVYNPVTSKQEKLTDVNQLESPIIEKGEGQANQVLPGENA